MSAGPVTLGPMGRNAAAVLACDGRPVTPVAIAASAPSRLRGLLGRRGLTGALLLVPARSVHTLGMRFPIDVAYLDADGTVLATETLAPNRVGRPVRRARQVIEAEAGSFERWGLAPGVRVDIVDAEAAA